MSNNDKFIRDTPYGKLMKSKNDYVSCKKCKYQINHRCVLVNEAFDCLDANAYYFAKDETDENKNLQNLQK